MSCITKITKGITYNCDDKPKAGIESVAIVFNRDDVDTAALTKDATNKSIITNLTLKSGATAFKIDNLKQVNVAGSTMGRDESGIVQHTNTFLARVFNLDADGLQAVNEYAEANGLVVIVETKYKGADNTAAFKVFGIDSGMVMSEGSYTSAEQSGAYVFTLSSEEGFGEDRAMYIWNETDYASTKAKFDNLLAPGV